MTRQFMFLAGLRFAKLGVGVGSLIIYGRLFGVGREMDVWVFGSGIVAAIGMLVWGPVNEISRARYMYQLAHLGEEGALQGMNQLIRFSLLVSALLIVLLLLGKSPLIDLLYPSYDDLVKRDVELLITLMAPTLLLGQLFALGSAFLNCRGTIFAPEWIGVAGGTVNILCVLAFEERYSLLALVFGFYAGLLVAITATLTLLIRMGLLKFNLQLIWGSSVRDYLKFSRPLFLSYGAGQANSVLEKSLATAVGDGALSSINYAAQIKTTLQSVITSVLFSLAVPQLAQAAAMGDVGRFDAAWREVQRFICYFVLIMVPPIFGAAGFITQLLFKTADSSTIHLAEIDWLIRSYLAALLPVAFYLVHGAALLAQQKGGQYSSWGVASQVISALLSIVLLAPFGAFAFPIALAVSHSLAAVFMARAVGPSLQLWREASLIIVALSAASCFWMLLAPYAQVSTGSPLLGLISLCASHAVLLAFIYACYRYSGAAESRQGQE